MADKKQKKSGSYLGVGLALGVVFGLALDNLAVGIALGVVFGVTFDGFKTKENSSSKKTDGK